MQILNKSSQSEKGIDNIIKLKRIIFINKTGVLNLVFEFMEKDLLNLMKSYEPNRLPESKIKDIIYQTLLGLSYMHKYGFFHRDLKPENLLLVGDKIKIADFGLAREIRSIPPYTEYVSTRYYRAPECILKSTNYNSPIDIWALGCVMAEMYLHPQPLFYGVNEKEVLFRICSILGTPTYDIWPEGIQQANYVGIKFPNSNKTDLENIIPNASPEAIDLMNQMLKWDPNHRATASSLLNHPFFEKYKTENNNINNNKLYTSTISNYSNIDFNVSNSKIYYDNKATYKKETNKNYNNSISDFNYDNKEGNNKISNNSEFSDSLLMTNKKVDETAKKDNKRDEDNFSDMLDDTDGFNKLLSQLKQEKIEDEKEFENNKNNYNKLFLSIEKKLDINNDETKVINEFNELMKKEEKKKEASENKEKDSLSTILSGLNLNSNSGNDNSNKVKNNDNNYNGDNLTNKDNNDEYGFENAVRLKPMIKNNRRGSARKFLEENENNMNMNKIGSNNNNNQNNPNNERKLKYNLSNNLMTGLYFDKNEYTKPTIVRNEHSFIVNGNDFFEAKPKNAFEVNSNNFKNMDSNFRKAITLTNNNNNYPYYLNKQKRGSNYYQNENNWNL